jgi:hypothetical protein
LAEPLEKSSTSSLPDPRLNPLMNPTLGRNLGRWAQVYFTSPPEKRESAVVELLRELEGDAPFEPPLRAGDQARAIPNESKPAPTVVNQIAVNEISAPEIHTKPVEPEHPITAEPEIVSPPPAKKDVPLPEQIECPSCRKENPASQAYCGICGAGLHSEGRERTSEVSAAQAAPPPAYAERELQWLRERVPENWSEEELESSHPWRYVTAALVILLGVIAYVQWAPRNTAVAPATPAVSAPASVTSPGAETAGTAHSAPLAAAPAVARAAAVAKVQTESKPADRSRAEIPASARGAQELVEAQRLLAIPGQSGDTSEAAKLLWKAVGKQNPSATLMLADLYLRGEGVQRNCEQARLLLAAAAKNGSSDAAGRLRQVEASGCP